MLKEMFVLPGERLLKVKVVDHCMKMLKVFTFMIKYM